MRRLAIILPLLFPLAACAQVPEQAQRAAAHAVEHYDDDQVEVLAQLVTFRTVAEEGVPNWENPEFRRFAAYVKDRAEEYGLDFTDLGAILVVGLGDSEDRLGIVTHGDVQPADPSKWRKSPFELDSESEPGKLIARGTEDDKAPIATALQALRTLKELKLPLKRRVELIISLTEESDWEPFREVLTRWDPPQLNVAIDSDYPVVVAEKGWGGVWVEFAPVADAAASLPRVERLQGGAFISQVPEDALIEIVNADAAMVKRIRERIAKAGNEVRYHLEESQDRITITAKGKAAHSASPQHGINAIAHAAALLEGEKLADTAGGRAIDFINTLVGTGVYGEKFGNAAYRHHFMGPLTLNLSTAKTQDGGVELAINTRAPAGKTAAELESDMRAAITGWAQGRGHASPEVRVQMSEPHYPERPAHIAPLLAVFKHYTGQHDAEPISIGGGTNARLLPNGVNFGPSMPGAEYTGHSEHEFITREQMTLNLRMYTAMMTWLGMHAE